jgi:hypothetical protein
MHKLTLAALALAALGFTATATLSSAQAENYWGPLKANGQCWKKQLGNSLGYWTECPDAKAANASATTSRSRKHRSSR